MIDINKKYYLSANRGFILVVDEDLKEIPYQVDIKIKQGCIGTETPVYVTLLCRFDKSGRRVQSKLFEEIKNITYEFVGKVGNDSIDEIPLTVCRVSEDV